MARWSGIERTLRAEGARLIAHEIAGAWHDIGDLDSYLRANLDLLAGRASLVHETASVDERLVLDSVIVGERGRLRRGEAAAGDEVRRVVVWPGASIAGPLENAIVVGSDRVIHVG